MQSNVDCDVIFSLKYLKFFPLAKLGAGFRLSEISFFSDKGCKLKRNYVLYIRHDDVITDL